LAGKNFIIINQSLFQILKTGPTLIALVALYSVKMDGLAIQTDQF